MLTLTLVYFLLATSMLTSTAPVHLLTCLTVSCLSWIWYHLMLDLEILSCLPMNVIVMGCICLGLIIFCAKVPVPLLSLMLLLVTLGPIFQITPSYIFSSKLIVSPLLPCRLLLLFALLCQTKLIGQIFLLIMLRSTVIWLINSYPVSLMKLLAAQDMTVLCILEFLTLLLNLLRHVFTPAPLYPSHVSHLLPPPIPGYLVGMTRPES